jgi:hypothetical protein
MVMCSRAAHKEILGVLVNYVTTLHGVPAYGQPQIGRQEVGACDIAGSHLVGVGECGGIGMELQRLIRSFTGE